MTEILTESFCERCGTRYTFELSAPRKSRIGRVRTFSKGVKNFVMSDEASFEEAMADARGEEELAATSHQLDAFHKTFNFCLTCRQYTCGDCWNPTEGRCLTCAPMEGRVEPAIAAATVPMAADVAATNGHDTGAAEDDLWPEADLSQDRLARALGAEAVVADESIEDEVPSQLEVDAAAQAFDVPEAAAAQPVVDAPEAAAAELFVEAPAMEAAGIDEAVDDQPTGMDDTWLDLESIAEDGAADVVASVEDEGQATAEVVATEGVAAGEDAELTAAATTAAAAQEAAAFDAQASAAEQDATAEAAMDPALEFDVEDDVNRGVSGVAPGQSLEEAIAAYEARLAAEERDALEAAPESAPQAADAIATAPIEEVAAVALEPAIEATAADAAAEVVAPESQAEPAIETSEPALAAAAPFMVDEPDAAAELAAPAEAAPEVGVEPVVAEADDRDEHQRALAAFAAAALAAEPDEPAAEAIPDDFVTPAVLAARFEPEPEPEPVAAAPEPEPVAAEPEPVAVAPEPIAIEPEVEPVAAEPEPVAVAAEAEPEPVAAEPEPVAAGAAEPEPEPVAPEPEPVAASEGTAGVDVVPQPTWPTTDTVPPATPAAPQPAPEPEAPSAVPWLMVAPEETTRPEPQWPSTPAWRAGAQNTDAPTTLAGRTLLPQPDASALWAASAREVLSAPPVDEAVSTTPQPCVQCGLSLSASARFCRRCGTRQA